MISDVECTICFTCIVIIAAFMVTSFRKRSDRLMYKLYFWTAAVLGVWLLGVALLRFVAPEELQAQVALDAVTNIGGAFAPVFCLLIALAFIHDLERMPLRYYLLFIVPVLTNILVWTNAQHHLVYREFSIRSDQIVFGPYMFVSGVYSYTCMGLAVIRMLYFARRSGNSLYIKQAVLFSLGTIIPVAVNLCATMHLVPVSISATPLAFVATILLHGFAIFHFHMLDIRPIALQHVLDWIADCYLVVNEDGFVVSCNQSFLRVFGERYGVRENMKLREALKAEDVESKSGLYNMLAAVESCRSTNSAISYEQAVLTDESGESQKIYYMVDVTALWSEEKRVGFVLYFRDVTKIKESMQRLQDSQARMMEKERLASLGQMVGGLAHNLKTPIMSISGSVAAARKLVDECVQSLGDPEVTPEDYREIYGEMLDWSSKISEACAYMSDIITAVKGQAANMSAGENGTFTVDTLFKRVSLLLRHELLRSACQLSLDNRTGCTVSLHGDINSLVQVLNNLVTNAIDALQGSGGDVIRIELYQREGWLHILVRDRGCGVPWQIRSRLFRQMITSKGAQGTGLGVFISNSIVRAQFGGEMWLEDNPGGGSVFGVSISPEHVTFERTMGEEGTA